MNEIYDADVSFREEQRFHPILPRMVGIFSPVLSISVLYYVLFLQKPGSSLPPAVKLGFIGVIVVGDIAIAAWLGMTRLITEVRYDSLRIRLKPGVDRTIPYSDIAKIKPRTCNPLFEFGGWGVKRGKGGKAYLLRGNQGVQLELTSGERVYVGSCKAEELAQAINDRMR